MNLYNDAKKIIDEAIKSALPDNAVKKALAGKNFGDKNIFLLAVGKAAWQMANAAFKELGGRISEGIVITKHGYSGSSIGNLKIFEAGHPVPDADTYRATEEAVAMAESLGTGDILLFLISGGGSALFEKPAVAPEELESITSRLLSCGADIVEINTVRKRLSTVKGGKFAELCAPAEVFSVILSDVLGDSPDAIASGPAYPDSTTCADAIRVADKYNLPLSDSTRALLGVETPKKLGNVETVITGSVSLLCRSAEKTAAELGYKPFVLTDMLCCEASQAGSFLGSIARTYAKTGEKLAFIAGGETVVKLTGDGKGGRNQELALAAAEEIKGIEGVACFSVGSDGTDGPTDAAGGYTDWLTAAKLKEIGLTIPDVLNRNDSYNALKRTGGLIFTGPTGTNVNDLSVILINGKEK